MKICEICGCNENETQQMYGKNTKHSLGMVLCYKHYQQSRRSGKITNPNKQVRNQYQPNEIILCEDYAIIILYDKDGVKNGETLIDLDDVERCKDYKWTLNRGYVSTRVNNKNMRLQRYLMNVTDVHVLVDHINRETLNNRKSNLRTCTNQENSWNRSKSNRTNSGTLGVCWNKYHKKWVSQIKINKKAVHLGYFTDKEDAIRARQEAEIKYFGEFAPT